MPTLSKIFNRWKIAFAYWLAAGVILALFAIVASAVQPHLVIDNTYTTYKTIIIGNSTSATETITIPDESGNYTITAYNFTLNKSCSAILLTNGTFNQAVNGTNGTNTRGTIINNCFKINYVGTATTTKIIIYATGFKMGRSSDAAVFSWTFKDGSKIDKIVVTKTVKEVIGNSYDFSFIISLIGLALAFGLIIKGTREVGIRI